MDLQVVVWESMYWIDLAEDRVLVNAVMKIRVSYNEGNFLTSQFYLIQDSCFMQSCGENVTTLVVFIKCQ